MLKKTLLFFVATILSSHLCFAQSLDFRVDLSHTAMHKVNVELDLKKCGAQTVTYQMPVWAPGAYSVTHYGHYISNFKAFNSNGNILDVTQVNGDGWSIANAKDIAKISYTVSDSHRDSTSLYFALAHIDTNYFFANGTCLFGYVNDKKNMKSIVMYDFPKTWQVSTALDPLIEDREEYYEKPDFTIKAFTAKNYDELADAPVMGGTALQTRTFKEGKAFYDIVLESDKVFPMDSLMENTKKIVHAETEFFHDTPFEHYTFLINAPTFFKSPSGGQGALEHMNSSAYLLINFPWKTFKEFGLSVLSHEFFHAWNVKRIHSSLLGPFDYTQRVKTTSLWLSEGITDYYAHTILTRWNLMPYSFFERTIKELTDATNNSKSARTKTLEELSIAESDFDLTNATVFYSKGTLVGLMLDIEIRSRTNNKKSLDNVMLALNAEAKQGKTFKDNELIEKMEKITGLNLQSFYKKYIAGTDSLPIDDYLKKMGVGRNETSHSEEHINFGANFKLSSNHEIVFESVESGSALEKAGILPNDTLKKLNGEPFTLEKAMEFGETHKSTDNQTLELDIARSSGMKHFSVVLDKPSSTSMKATYDVAPLPNASPLEVAIRHGIVGKDY